MDKNDTHDLPSRTDGRAAWIRRRRRLAPSGLRREVRGFLQRVRNRLTGRYRRVFHVPAATPVVRGNALVSFWVDAFLLPPGKPIPIGHTHFWESRQIALTWAALGFDTDVIHWTNTRFVPEKHYDVCVDVRLNLERLAPLLGDDCLRIQHIETGHHRFHNDAQQARLDAIAARRGVRLKPYKRIEENRAIESAHAGTTTGNAFTIGTYAHAGRTIHRVGISTPNLFPAPEHKDFEACRRRWLWFGSSGLVHKGLDLVLEAFAGMPDHELVVCAPVAGERDFEREYQQELYGTPNIRMHGWVDNGSAAFQAIIESCVGLCYPSCSEGGGGSVIVCLHAGLIPLITYETSVDVHDFGELLADCSVEGIRAQVRALSARSPAELRDLAMKAWTHAREHHSRARFEHGYRSAAERILGEWEARKA